MAPAKVVPGKLPSKEQLREVLKNARDSRILDGYLEPVQRQTEGRRNRLRVLLQTCTELGNERLVEALLCRHADVNATTQTSFPPLIYATRQGNVSLIKMFLHWNADIEVTDRSGKTALLHAASNGKSEAAKLLLESGANIEAVDKEARNAVMYAASSDTITVLQVLLSNNANVNVVDRHRSNAVSLAAANGNADALAVLLDRNADLNIVDDQAMTPAIHAASRAHHAALKLLLHHGADCSKADSIGKTAVLHAAENNDIEALRLLSEYQADFSGVDLQGRTPMLTAILSEKKDMIAKLETIKLLLSTDFKLSSNANSISCLGNAALRGQNDILNLLVKEGANVNAVDDSGRTALLYLASDPSKQTRWDLQTVSTLLYSKANVYKVDYDRKRTALQWAAATGQYVLAQAVLSHLGPGDLPTYVNISSSRSKTALHLAAQHNYDSIIRLLLNNHAKVDCRSEGGWTPFLIAAKAGHRAAVDALLAAADPADVNARTSSGMTALHWASENGHVSVVQRILAENKAWKNPKDSFDTTPLSRADRHGRKDVVELLRDHIFTHPTSKHAENACALFGASVVDFFPVSAEDRFRSDVRRLTVRDVLYARDPDPRRSGKFAITTKLDDIKKGAPSFRWIHLPANNLAWAEMVITKMIVEGGPIDNAGFQSMLRIFGQQQHRGTQAHSRFMRPLCQIHGDDYSRRTPKFSLSKPPVAPSRTSTSTFEDTLTLNGKLGIPDPATSNPVTPQAMTASPTPTRRNTAQPQDGCKSKSIGVLFMPYLHWETNSNRQLMRDIVRYVMEGRGPAHRVGSSRDECLIRGYLRHATDLHLRRTLDQFRYHNINTDKRDKDQVVYRHHTRSKASSKKDPKIFMVDQLWIWVFDSIVLTCFPERWNQPTRDPLNLFDGVIEDINSSTFPPVRSVQDLAAAITNRCTGSFDRHEWGYEDIDFMFFEIFELSIGTLTRRATALLERFEGDSTAASRWLKSRDQLYIQPNVSKKLDEDRENEEDDFLQQSDDDMPLVRPETDPLFVNRLLNISKETKLLVECKDIEDELAILHTVLDQQLEVLKTMADTLRVPRKRAGLQIRVVTQHLLDIQRMQRAANGVSKSLTQLLDLKQKHANAIEARFARDQAEDTARQGQTIMVFTIVTIIFLPLSFMAAFFTIDIVEFPHNSANGRTGLHIGWVSKYLFGIGFAVSVPLIATAFLIANARGSQGKIQSWFGKRRTTEKPHSDPPQTGAVPARYSLDRPSLRERHGVDARTSSRDSEGYVFPRRNTVRVQTGLTSGTMDSEV